MFKNLNVISVPIFIKEYLLRDKDKQLSSLIHEVNSIIEQLSFNTTKRGYRDIIYATIPDIDGYRFTMGVFFKFALDKTSKVNDNNTALYSKELNIDDSVVNEVFEAIVTDEYGDNVSLNLILDDYNSTTNEISFMLL